jgi:hypothetical protein
VPHNAYVFARPGGALILGLPYGHVAFGFQTDDTGTICVGGVEVVTGKTSHVGNAMDFWKELTTDPLTFMSSQTPYGIETRYDMCKILNVNESNIAAAMTEVAKLANVDYNLLSQNCRTDTVQVLQSYGVTGLPGGARPSGFFGGIDAPIVPLTAPWPGKALDFSLYEEPEQYGIRDDPDLNEYGYVADPTADQNPNGPDFPPRYYNSFLLRRGFLVLFPEENYAGTPFIAPVGRVVDFRELPWPDKMVCSWYAAPESSDPSAVTSRADQIVPRFGSDAERKSHHAQLGLPPHHTFPDQIAGARGH